MLDDRAERELIRMADRLLARLYTAPNEDSQREWIYQALSKAWTLGETQKTVSQ